MVARLVCGNVLRLAIPLTLRTITLVDGKVDTEDTPFIPNPDYPVIVQFDKRSATTIKLEATMRDGNIAVVEDKGNIPIGTYAVTVLAKDDKGDPYRFKKKAGLIVVDATKDAGIEAGVEYEVTTQYLDAAIFPGLVIVDARANDKASTDQRPIVHRALPMTPQIGSRYFFEVELRLKFPNPMAAAAALETMAPYVSEENYLVFQGGKHLKFQDLAELKAMQEAPGEAVQVCFPGTKHVMLCCRKGQLLDEMGQVDYAYLAQKFIVSSRRIVDKPTCETRSPNFRVVEGHVVCVALCDRYSLNRMIDSKAKWSGSQFVTAKPAEILTGSIRDGVQAFANTTQITVTDLYASEDEPVKPALAKGENFILARAAPIAGKLYCTSLRDSTLVGEVLEFLGETRADIIGKQVYKVKIYDSGVSHRFESGAILAPATRVDKSQAVYQRQMERLDKKVVVMYKQQRRSGRREHAQKKERRWRLSINGYCRRTKAMCRFHRIVRKKYVSINYYRGALAFISDRFVVK